MKGFNSVQMIGNIGQEIEVRTTNSGTAVTTLRLAVNERAKVNGEWGDVTNWFDVVCWGKTAELCGQYLNKGSSVFIVGRLSVRSFEDKTGQKRTKTEIVAEDVKFLGGKESSSGSYTSGNNQYGGGGGGSSYDNNKYYNNDSESKGYDYE
jgi:single-strand DNA-binding protein